MQDLLALVVLKGKANGLLVAVDLERQPIRTQQKRSMQVPEGIPKDSTQPRLGLLSDSQKCTVRKGGPMPEYRRHAEDALF